jgi:hypothetical protein
MRIHTTHTRDAALNKLQRVNRWMIAASVALTGGLSAIAANAFPGKTVKGTAGRHGTRTKAKATHSGGTSTGVLRAPEQAPRSSSESEASSAETHTEAQAPQEAPEQESAPAEEPAPSQESAPSQETAPAEPAPETPAVSGGS